MESRAQTSPRGETILSRKTLLSEQQIHSFDRFLLDGTYKILNTLETMYEFDIDSSDSNIEIDPANDSQFLTNMGNGVLYTVSSALMGEMEGNIQLMMRSSDFDCVGDLMKPVLSLLFLSSPDTDLKTLDCQKPDWMDSQQSSEPGVDDLQEQIIEAVGELCNMLIGQYTKAIYNMCAMNVHHTMPETIWCPGPISFQGSLISPEMPDQAVLAIENEFQTQGGTISIWCVIFLTEGSFLNLLTKIGSVNEIV